MSSGEAKLDNQELSPNALKSMQDCSHEGADKSDNQETSSSPEAEGKKIAITVDTEIADKPANNGEFTNTRKRFISVEKDHSLMEGKSMLQTYMNGQSLGEVLNDGMGECGVTTESVLAKSNYTNKEISKTQEHGKQLDPQRESYRSSKFKKLSECAGTPNIESDILENSAKRFERVCTTLGLSKQDLASEHSKSGWVEKFSFTNKEIIIYASILKNYLKEERIIGAQLVGLHNLIKSGLSSLENATELKGDLSRLSLVVGMEKFHNTMRSSGCISEMRKSMKSHLSSTTSRNFIENKVTSFLEKFNEMFREKQKKLSKLGTTDYKTKINGKTYYTQVCTSRRTIMMSSLSTIVVPGAVKEEKELILMMTSSLLIRQVHLTLKLKASGKVVTLYISPIIPGMVIFREFLRHTALHTTFCISWSSTFELNLNIGCDGGSYSITTKNSPWLLHKNKVLVAYAEPSDSDVLKSSGSGLCTAWFLGVL